MKTIADLPLGLTFDDVSLVPCYSEVLPSGVDVQVSLTQKLTLSVPFFSAAMDTVTQSEMAIELAGLGGIGIIHKNLSIERQAEEVAKVKRAGQLLCGAAVGPGEDLEKRAHALVEVGADLLAMDTAHGHSKSVVDGVKRLRGFFPNLAIMAGNIVTGEAAKALADAGANIVKVGIGPGSICTTRVVAGVGVPQVSAIMDVAQVARGLGLKVVADGGIKSSGDVVKAIAAGADAVMIGSLFAGTDEAPGERVMVQGRTFKVYRGMGSLGAMAQGSSDRYGQGDVRDAEKFVPEGIEGRIPYRGSLASVLYHLVGGLRSGMGYVGAQNVQMLQEKARFVRITVAGLRESHVHDVMITNEAPNYDGRAD